jgi:DNA-binding GntR family transcriptional regulator
MTVQIGGDGIRGMNAIVSSDGDNSTEYRTMQEIVLDYLRSEILRGRMPPGTRLNQYVFAEQLRVSRMPVREALRTLQAEGLVELQPHRSAIVVSLEPDDIAEIFDIRATLEARAAQLAASRLSDEAIDRLRELDEEMSRALEAHDERWLLLHREFHRTIYSASGWSRLSALIEAQFNALAPYERLWAQLSAHNSTAFRKGHSEVLQAAETRDPNLLAARLTEHTLKTPTEINAQISNRRAIDRPAPDDRSTPERDSNP